MKSLLTVVSVFAAASALAVQLPAGKAMSFSSVGPDTYSDGTPVMQGEWYALCWSPDGSFDGIAADGSAVNPEERVVCRLAGATDEGTGVMHCPPVIVQMLTTEYDNGVFEVFLLDTRKYEADGDTVKVSVCGRTTSGLVVNMAKRVPATLKLTSNATAPEMVVSAEGVSATEVTALPADYSAGKVRITDMQIGAEYVTIKVENTVPYLNYAATSSSKLGGEGTVGNPLTGKAGEPIYLVAPNTGSTGFFSVNRK